MTSPTRTLIDIAGHETPARLTAALDSALRDGLTSEDLLHRRIAALRTKGRHGIPSLLDVLAGQEVTRGGHSWLEREYLRLLATAGLPRPISRRCSHGRRSVRPRGLPLPGHTRRRRAARLPVPPDPAADGRDAERLNALLLEGLVPFQLTYGQVVTSPDAAIATTAPRSSQTRRRHRSTTLETHDRPRLHPVRRPRSQRRLLRHGAGNARGAPHHGLRRCARLRHRFPDVLARPPADRRRLPRVAPRVPGCRPRRRAGVP